MFGRKKYDLLEQRLTELERRFESHATNDVLCRNFDVFEELPATAFRWPARAQIAVKDVVQQILDRLGMHLVYVEGQPTTAEIQKKPKS